MDSDRLFCLIAPNYRLFFFVGLFVFFFFLDCWVIAERASRGVKRAEVNYQRDKGRNTRVGGDEPAAEAPLFIYLFV